MENSDCRFAVSSVLTKTIQTTRKIDARVSWPCVGSKGWDQGKASGLVCEGASRVIGGFGQEGDGGCQGSRRKCVAGSYSTKLSFTRTA